MRDQKCIFITGAASGIGRAVAERFGREGWFVGLSDVNRDGLDEVADAIGRGTCMTMPLDVTDRAAWDRALGDFSRETGGRLDLFFNNAGIAQSGPFDTIPEDKTKLLIDINFNAVVHGIYATVDMLKATAAAKGRAQIVNTGSASGIMGAPSIAVYSATKFAVRGLTDALSVELYPYDIFVTQIQPWFLDTKILDTVSVGSNAAGRDQLVAQKIPVLPPTLASDAVWELANAKAPRVHVQVGRPAKIMHFMARFFPGRLYKSVRDRYVREFRQGRGGF